eukprot:412223_1
MSQLKTLLDLIKSALSTIRNTKHLKKLLAFATIAIIWYKYFRLRCRKHDNIPSLPDCLPLTGHAWMIFKHFNRMEYVKYDLVKRADFPKCCSFAFKLPFFFDEIHSIALLDPELIKFVFHTKFESFRKGERLRTAFGELLGDGIFLSDPPEWTFHRKVASRMFSTRNLKDFMYECTIKHTEKVINKINSRIEQIPDEYINIYDMLARFTLDCFTDIAFGKSVDSVSIYPTLHPFSEAFDNLITSFPQRFVQAPFMWKPIRMLPECLTFGNEYKIKRDIKIINEFAFDVLNSRQHMIANISDECNDKYNDIISLFIKNDPNLTNKQLKDIAMNMIIAGRDTTRLLLSWFFYEMCLEHNSDIKSKIYTEIDNWIVNNNGKTEIDYQKVNDSLLYLESTLLETLRLHPAVPFLIRFAMEDVELPNGNIIRKGDEVVIPTYAFARNPNVFQNPLKFDPLRFFNKGKDPINVYDVYRYPFFNVNPRLCLGRKLALMESKIFVFYFFQQYNFEMADKNQQIKIKTGMVLNMVDGLRLKLIKKSEP